MNGERGRRSGFLGVVAGVVLAEQIAAEVTVEIAPDRVDVVGLILGIVEFDHEGFPLNAVIVPGAAIEDAGPSEGQALEIGSGGGGEGGIRDFGAVAGEIKLEQGAELCRTSLKRHKALGLFK